MKTKMFLLFTVILFAFPSYSQEGRNSCLSAIFNVEAEMLSNSKKTGDDRKNELQFSLPFELSSEIYQEHRRLRFYYKLPKDSIPIYVKNFLTADDKNDPFSHSAEIYLIKAINTDTIDTIFKIDTNITISKKFKKNYDTIVEIDTVAIIKQLDSLIFYHNFLVYTRLGDVKFMNDDLDSCVYYYKQAEQCLAKSPQSYKKEYYNDLIVFYYKFGNILLSLSPPAEQEAKKYFNQCKNLAQKYNNEDYKNYAERILNFL